MGRKKANHPLIESLEIVAVAAEGKALGRWNDIVVFVPMAVPGDVVDVQKCQKTLFVYLKLIFAILKPWFSIFFLSLHHRTF
mgnify:CR=1 FL=1